MKANPIVDGSYRAAEVARWLDVPVSTLRSWFSGNEKSIFDPAYGSGREGGLSFLNVIEALVASKLRDKGVRAVKIRNAHRGLKKRLKTLHPFANECIRTDGHTVLHDLEREVGNLLLLEADNGQINMREVVSPFLDSINFDEEGMVSLWEISPGVVLNPRVQFGHPVTKQSHILTDVLFDAWKTCGQDSSEVARWYEIEPNEVENAVRFEQQFVGKDSQFNAGRKHVA